MAEYRTVTVQATITEQAVRATASISDMVITAGATIATPVSHFDMPVYDGAYEVTPTQDTQTLVTDGKQMTGDVIIHPIPSNYGLITWNGSTLTVS